MANKDYDEHIRKKEQDKMTKKERQKTLKEKL